MSSPGAAEKSSTTASIQSPAAERITANNSLFFCRIQLTLNLVNRSDFPFTLASVKLPFQTKEFIIDESVNNNHPYENKFTITVPHDRPYTQPYWLQSKGSMGLFAVEDQELIGMPETESISLRVTLFAGDEQLTFVTPIVYRWTSRVAGEQYRPLEIIPAVAINTEQRLYVFSDSKPKEVGLLLKAGRDEVSGNLRLQLPAGWQVKPETLQFALAKKDEESRLYFSVTPPNSASAGSLVAKAQVGQKTLSHGLHIIDYPHIPKQTLFPLAEAKLLRLDIKKNNERIAYIMGSGDEVPDYLKQLGYAVDFLTDADLDDTELDQYDTIIAGVRAYNTRSRLKQFHKRLMNYVYSGGTYIVQYNTSRGMVVDNVGPYPLRLSRDRVSVEDAPVSLNLPNHLLLNTPNKITLADFDGWIQERGLYFADQWDDKYETPLSSHDPGETEKFGSIVYGQYGEGVFIYTGLSWFRELPAGIPGAYRLFVNLISAGSAHEQETN